MPGLPSDVPKRLYHYTSVEGVRGIMESRSLWATNIHHLNDHQELKHAIELAQGAIRDLAHAASGGPTRVLEAMGTHLEHYLSINMFVFSLSEMRDQLSQWRAYCSAGGYALGFDGPLLAAVAQREGFMLVRCIYDANEQRELVKTFVESYAAQASGRLGNAPSAEAIDNEGYHFAERFVQSAPRLKHPSFAEEAEWRLISSFVDMKDARIAVRTRGGIFVPHLVVRLDAASGHESALPVEFVVGPMRERFLAENGLAQFLSCLGLKQWSISPSHIPYRTW